VRGYDAAIFCLGWNVTLPLCQLALRSSNSGTKVTSWLISTCDEEKSEFATLPVRHRASGMFLKNQKTDKVLQDWASQIEASLNEVRCFP
jgi:hypothetical protein